jgi:phosphoheptose isomerase
MIRGMRELGEIVAEVLEAGRAREQVFADNARQLGQAVTTLLEALTGPGRVHTCGEGRSRHLAAYLAEVFFAGDGTRALPARLLEGPPGPEGLSRAVEAHVREGDVLLLLAVEDSPRVAHALARARELGARSLAILTPEASLTAGCDLGIVVDLEGHHALEGFLAVGHALWEMVHDGLVRVRRGDDPLPPPSPPDPELVPRFGGGEREEPARPKAASRPERRRSTRITVRDAYVRWRDDRFPEPDEYAEPHLLEDLSLTGLRFRGSRAQDLQIGDEVFACLDLPLYTEPVRLRAQVRRLAKIKEPGGYVYSVGAKVVEWIADARQRVRRVVEDDSLRTLRRR